MNYKYNGKELQETGMYDYGARFYMPDVGRWGVHDPLSEKTLDPYGYVNGNPIMFTDPTGMEGEDWVRRNGVWEYEESITTVEQAKKHADIDGFAKNGTVLADARINGGETGYVRLKAGGIAEYPSNDHGSAFWVAFSNSAPMWMGGTWTTWTHEEFPMLTATGGLRTADPKSQDKLIPGDKVFLVDDFITPSTLPSSSGIGGRFSAFSNAFSSLVELFATKKEPDSVFFKAKLDFTLNSNSTIKDTLIKVPNNNLPKRALKQGQIIDSINNERRENYNKYYYGR